MFDHILQIQGNILAIKITGAVTENEHGQLDRLFREAFAKWVNIRMVIVIHHYPSLNSAESLYADLRMVKKHSGNIERLAVIENDSGSSRHVIAGNRPNRNYGFEEQ